MSVEHLAADLIPRAKALEDRIKVLEYNLAYLARVVEQGFDYQGLPNSAHDAKRIRDYYQESRI